MPEVNIRKADKKDTEYLTEFVTRLKQVNEELDPMYIVHENLRQIANEYISKSLERDDVIILVAEHRDRVIGMVRAEIIDRLFYTPRYEGLITDIYVHPSYRRKKIAEKLIARLAEELKARKIELLSVIFPPGNRIAEKFFKKQGFRPLQVRLYKKVS